MNQEQIKNILLQLRDDLPDFTLVFSGKASKKVHGLYKPETKEIIIHNKNFTEDNSIVYTAIHEFAHHVQYCSSPDPISSRAHTIDFRNIFHNLLIDAEKLGLYKNPLDSHEELKTIAQKIKDSYLSVNGGMMKELGKMLIDASLICQKAQISFEDFLERALKIEITTAKTMMTVFTKDVDPRIGYDNMKIVARIKDPDDMHEAETNILNGDYTPDMVKSVYRPKESKPKNDADYLMLEKSRIEKKINQLQNKLDEIEQKLSDI